MFTVVGVIRRDLFAGARSGRLVAAPRAVGASLGQPAKQTKAKRGRAAHQLVVTAGQLAGTRITLSEAQITIGRAEDSTLVITDDYASGESRLVPRGRQCFGEDSVDNGTYLDRLRSPDNPSPAFRSGSAALLSNYGQDTAPR